MRSVECPAVFPHTVSGECKECEMSMLFNAELRARQDVEQSTAETIGQLKEHVESLRAYNRGLIYDREKYQMLVLNWMVTLFVICMCLGFNLGRLYGR